MRPIEMEGRKEVRLLDETTCTDCLGRSPRIAIWPGSGHQVLPATFPTRFICYIVLGSVLALTGIATLIWKPLDTLLNERLRMSRGLPPFEWWRTPPDEVILKAYVFNITNGDAFLRGEDEKLRVQEVGPYVFKEKLYHTNITFHDNGTMTYVATRLAVFLPELNTLSLDDRIIVANLATLGLPSYLWDASFVTKLGLSLLMSRMGSQPFVPCTVNQYLWNMTDPLLQFSRKMAPKLVPVENVGILHEIYRDFVDEVTVLIGMEHGHKDFFKIDKWRGGPGIGHWDNATCDSVQGSSEGVCYPQFLERTDTVKYLRKTICQAVTLDYTEDVTMEGIQAYKFDLPNRTWVREDGELSCFKSKMYPDYPSGITDVSPCYFNLPIVSSFPHFMSAAPEVTDRLEGLTPDWEKHGSVAIVEPTTGIPLTAWARSQSSLYVHNMRGFPKFKRLANMPIPMFWLEYKQMGLPYYIKYMVYFISVLVPSTQLIFSLSCLLTAFLIFSRVSSKMFGNFMLKRKGSYASLNVIYSKPERTEQ